MPVHEWAKADVGLFHHFHQRWAGEICDALNDGRMPAGYFALVEGKVPGWEQDVLAVALGARRPAGGIAVAEVPPKVRHVSRPASEAEGYAARASRVAVRNRLGRVVAVVEIVSPGNKDSANAVRAFVRKATELLVRGVNLLLIDLFPPTPRDPAGMYKAVWDEVREEPFDLPADKPLVLAACVGEPSPAAYAESVGVGDPLPPMPVFLDPGQYVYAPLEEAYTRTWDKLPREVKEFVQNPPPG